MPQRLEDLPRHSLIGFDRETPFIRSMRQSVRKGAATGWSRDMFGLRCDSNIAQLAAIRAGAGIGICQTGLACRAPQLTRLLADEVAFDLPIWLVTHADLRAVRRIRLLLDHLAVALGDYIATAQ